MLRRDAVYRIFNDDVMIGLVVVLALAVISRFSIMIYQRE
jgi:hypothetical protein